MTPEEHHQIRAFLADEPGAFAHLYAAYSAQLFSFCYRLCNNIADAEDLTQNVFVAAYQGRHRFEGRSSIRTWLYQIAVYQHRSDLKSKQNQVVGLTDMQAEELAAPDTHVSQLERLHLDRAITALPQNWRQAFLLVKVEGLTMREAAEVLRVPQGTVKFWVHKSIARLHETLQEEAVQAEDVQAEAGQNEAGRKEVAQTPGLLEIRTAESA